MGPIAIRALTLEDLASYRTARQRALAEHPDAFTSSAEEEARAGDAKLAKRLAPGPDTPHDVMLGAFDGAALVGTIGLSVDPRIKVRHRGQLFGMYVPAERAGRGIGRALIDALIRRAGAIGELDSLVLRVTSTNDRARRLYERAGFSAYGCEPAAIRVAGVPHDKLMMIRWLR
jgi:ribosomal protein S18 acetylase RimI-like enzyme